MNALTIDVEDWYHPQLIQDYIPSHLRISYIEKSLTGVLNLIDKYSIEATFFVLGEIAQKFPHLIEKIADHGHEIACHGLRHVTLCRLGSKKFRKEIKEAYRLIKSSSGEPPIGFRAPSFSLNNETIWALKILVEMGFKYDSSIFPTWSPLYGIPLAPTIPYHPSLEDLTRKLENGPIIEFPLGVADFPFIFKLPIAGGFYLRAFPLSLLKAAIRSRNRKGNPVVIYVHPWELYPPRIDIQLPIIARFVFYLNIHRTLEKLEFLIKNFKFTSIRRILELE